VVVKENRLRYLRLNQKKFHVDLYQGLKDTITASDNIATAIGQRITL
jgi:hypothetical protein